MLGISLWVWTLMIGFYVGSFAGKTMLRMNLRLAKKQKELLLLQQQVRKRLKSRADMLLPNNARVVYRPELQAMKEYNEELGRDGTLGNPLFASTGCELTDEIFIAANKAGIDTNGLL